MNGASSHLRLVSKHGAVCLSDAPASSAQEHRFVLAAAKPESLSLRKGSLSGLLQSLTEGESIAFIHERMNPTAKNLAKDPGYRFSVAARSTRLEHENLASRLHTSLRVASDILSFQPEESIREDSILLKHVWQATLSAVKCLHMPVQGDNVVFDPRTNPDQFELPNPDSLPAWCLTSLLNEDLRLPDFVRLSMRFSPRTLDDAQARQLVRIRHRIQSNEFALFDPNSPLKDYSASKQIASPICDLIGAWLRHPKGWSVDLLIEANEEINSSSIRRLTMDFAGNVKVDLRSMTVHKPIDVPVPNRFAAWLHHTQALPGILPDPRLLSSLGVPRLYPHPTKLPVAGSGVAIGSTIGGADTSVVYLPDEDRSSHLAILGSSGSGKSTCLLELIAQDMAAEDDRSVGLLDPHGTLYLDALDLVPKRRRKDVICIDVDDPDYVVCINPLEGSRLNPQKSSFVANEVVSLIDVLFEGQDTSGPVGRAHIRNALQLVAWIPDREGTFLDALRLFEEPAFMNYLLSKCKNRAVVAHFEKFKRSSGDHGFENWLPYIMPRLSPFCSSPVTRRMLNRPESSFDIRRAMAQGKILLFNLSTATLGNVESRIFGNLIMNQIFFTAMDFGPIRGTSRKSFHLIVDEAANMVSESMLPIWAQARKFGLSLTTANQSIGQLRNRTGVATIADGILANTSSKLMFRLGTDTERLQPYYRSAFSDIDMVELPVFHAVANIVDHGQPISPFVLKVKRPTHDVRQHADAKDCIDASNRSNAIPMSTLVDEMCRTFDLQVVDVGVPQLGNDGRTESDLGSTISLDKETSRSDVTVGKLFCQAMANAMCSKPGTRYPEDLKNIINGTYVAKDVQSLPDFDDVQAAIWKDNSLNTTTKMRLKLALLDIKSRFWPDQKIESGQDDLVKNDS